MEETSTRSIQFVHIKSTSNVLSRVQHSFYLGKHVFWKLHWVIRRDESIHAYGAEDMTSKTRIGIRVRDQRGREREQLLPPLRREHSGSCCLVLRIRRFHDRESPKRYVSTKLQSRLVSTIKFRFIKSNDEEI